jgi:hypothetical protein
VPRPPCRLLLGIWERNSVKEKWRLSRLCTNGRRAHAILPPGVVSSIRTQGDISTWQEWGHFYLGPTFEGEMTHGGRRACLSYAQSSH